MASPRTVRAELAAGVPAAMTRSRRIARVERRRLDPFPLIRWQRWLLRALFALPFVAVALVNGQQRLAGTVNAVLVERVASIDWTGVDATWSGNLYPPVSTLIAAITPGGAFGLSIVGSLVAGVLLQRIVEIMVQRRVPTSTAAILLIALAANPLFFFTAIENLPGFLGLAFFGLGLAHVVRFVTWGNTQSGFRAGILLMLAALTDVSGPLYVLTAALAAPFLRLRRSGQRGARWANVLVIVYPTAAALAALVALNTVFRHQSIGFDAAQLHGIEERLRIVGSLLTTIDGWLLVAPVVSAWLIALIIRRPGSIIVSTLVFVALLGAFVLGMLPSGAAGTTFIMMTLLAIALIPTARTGLANALVDLVGIGQIAIAWAAAFNRPVVLEWMQFLLSRH